MAEGKTPPLAFRTQAVPDFISDEMLKNADKDKNRGDDEPYVPDDDESALVDMSRAFASIAGRHGLTEQAHDADIRKVADDISNILLTCSYWQNDGFMLVSDVLGRDRALTMDDDISHRLSSSWNAFIPTPSGMSKANGWLGKGMDVCHNRDNVAPLPALVGSMFGVLSNILSDARHRSVGYPDYAYHDEHERPHLAPYDEEWEHTQMLGTVSTMKSTLKEVERDGQRLYSVKTRGELSCPWCAWVDDLDYAESVLALASNLLDVNGSVSEYLNGNDIESIEADIGRTWQWLGRHLGDLQ